MRSISTPRRPIGVVEWRVSIRDRALPSTPYCHFENLVCFFLEAAGQAGDSKEGENKFGCSGQQGRGGRRRLITKPILQTRDPRGSLFLPEAAERWLRSLI
jgi:hypothetical protein